MNEHELIQWLTSWVERATGVDSVDPTTPLETYGLASRDAVILTGELEKLLGRRVDPTVAYQYPTIAALAKALLTQERVAPKVERREAASSPATHDIAIVGSAGRFPGAPNNDAFWQLLISGRSASRPLPPMRWDEYLGDPVVRTKMAEENTDGGYMDGIASFDHEFFGVSPLEAQNMDPQQRIMLEVAWEALEDAGLAPSELRGEPVGVFVGSSNNDYGMLITADPNEAHPYLSLIHI